MSEIQWRSFEIMEIIEAFEFAKTGIAVHDNSLGWEWSKGGPAAHMFGPDEETLIAAAKSIGLRPEWIQRNQHIHFDLKGAPLAKALKRCEAFARPALL